MKILISECAIGEGMQSYFCAEVQVMEMSMTFDGRGSTKGAAVADLFASIDEAVELLNRKADSLQTAKKRIAILVGQPNMGSQ